MKTRRPTDSTIRNVKAANKRLAVHALRLKDLEARMRRLEKAVRL